MSIINFYSILNDMARPIVVYHFSIQKLNQIQGDDQVLKFPVPQYSSVTRCFLVVELCSLAGMVRKVNDCRESHLESKMYTLSQAYDFHSFAKKLSLIKSYDSATVTVEHSTHAGYGNHRKKGSMGAG